MTSAAADAATLPLETLFLSLDDLLLHVFVLVDDLYDQIAPDALRRRPGVHRLKMSDSEILTLSLVQEALSIDCEDSFHRSVGKDYLHLFPKLVSRERYHRRRKALLYLHQMLFHHIARDLACEASHLIIDSAPVETVAFVRSQSGQASIPEASYGFIPSKKRVFFGLRLHALVTSEGAVDSEGAVADFTLVGVYGLAL